MKTRVLHFLMWVAMIAIVAGIVAGGVRYRNYLAEIDDKIEKTDRRIKANRESEALKAEAP